ncbi:MAG TPA: helix-turn-helix domain-containing protein [Bryobacteraceae bacterium]|nr:helix-turn-helix domain-containing protein [Bryobacteraceae bacterium]
MGFSQPVFPNLPALRRQKGVTLESICAATRIGKRYLEAIERGEFTVLPGGIYDISYIRQYARAVDFDEEELLACYLAVTDSEKHCSISEAVDQNIRPMPFPQSLPLVPRSLFTVSIRKLRKT